MSTYRRGAVTVRISDRDMEKALQVTAQMSAEGAAANLVKRVQAWIDRRPLKDSGALRSSISYSKAGRLRGSGAVFRVYPDKGIAPHASMQHAGSGPIYPKNGKYLYLKYRKSSAKRRGGPGNQRAWRAGKTRGYDPQPFLEEPYRTLRERDFVYLVAKKKPLGKPPTGQKPSQAAKQVTGGFSKFIKSQGGRSRI